jgi:hypothetical protein
MGRLLELFSLVPPPPRLAPKQTMTWVREDASRQSLQPTYCQRAPLKPTNSRAPGSHQADRLFRVWPSANTLVLGSDTAPSEGASNSPKASPIPSDATIGVVAPVVVRHRSHLLGGHPCFSWGVSASALGSSPATNTERSDHSHSMSRCSVRTCLRKCGHRRTKNLFRGTPTKASTFEVQSAFRR